jgi:polyisoprenoid-binding protein YceI
VVGDLTIHGVTKTVDLNVASMTPEMKDGYGFIRRGAEAKTTILRSDFGLVYNAPLETGGVVIGDQIHITIDTELTRKA